MITKPQIRKIKTLLHQLEMKEEEILLISKYSTAENVSDMLTGEAHGLINYLVMKEPKSKSMNTMRRKMLYYGYEMRWNTPSTPAQHFVEASKVNYIHVDAWCMSEKSKYKKSLAGLTYTELEETLSQFEQLYKKYLARY